ncbi:MAG: winged helix-turn-helix transcriptional regulator [Euryarchaeota archaeon]|nr:winged helix-turn-helix transcriptional regulator [Euryarchaeota archaeon]
MRAFSLVFRDSAAARIMDALLEAWDGEISKTDLAKAAGISRDSVYRVFPEWEALGLVKLSRRVGVTKLYTINRESEAIKSLRTFDGFIAGPREFVKRTKKRRKKSQPQAPAPTAPSRPDPNPPLPASPEIPRLLRNPRDAEDVLLRGVAREADDPLSAKQKGGRASSPAAPSPLRSTARTREPPAAPPVARATPEAMDMQERLEAIRARAEGLFSKAPAPPASAEPGESDEERHVREMFERGVISQKTYTELLRSVRQKAGKA